MGVAVGRKETGQVKRGTGKPRPGAGEHLQPCVAIICDGLSPYHHLPI